MVKILLKAISLINQIIDPANNVGKIFCKNIVRCGAVRINFGFFSSSLVSMITGLPQSRQYLASFCKDPPQLVQTVDILDSILVK